MSLILRSLLRDPLVARPLTRALRRFDDDYWVDDWPAAKVRRVHPSYESPLSIMDDMNRQMVQAFNKMQEVAEDLGNFEAELLEKENQGNRGVKRRRQDQEALVQRTESGGLQLALDVREFKPEDLKIKLVDDNLVVEGVSEVSGKDSYKRNHFKRWFKVPEDCKLDEIKSKLTNDNKLLIELPMNKPAIEEKAREIPIENQRRQKPAEIKNGSENNNNHQAHHEQQAASN